MSLENLESVTLPCDLDEFDTIIDVRSPLEFAEDHLPGALNLPVLSDQQRTEVGTLYRGASLEARRFGAACISEAIARYLRGIIADSPHHWNPLLYCWRGGMRSRSFASVLRSVGWRARILEGGYKAWRRFVIEELDRLLSNPDLQFQVLAGLTGSGKTRLLTTLREAGAQVLDLEALANHRGSLLGSCGPQPSQKRFESKLYAALRELDPSQPVFCEAESSRIGSVYLPPVLWKRLPLAPVIQLTLPLHERVSLLLDEYGHFPHDPASLSLILDRLRQLRGHRQVDSWQQQIAAGQWPEFVASILVEHYDRCYRRPGSPDSVYQVPSRSIEISDASLGSYRTAAARLVSEACSASSR